MSTDRWTLRTDHGPPPPEPTTAETLRTLRALGAVPPRVARQSTEAQLRWVESECDAYDAWERWDADPRA